jgi:hypothetical protein
MGGEGYNSKENSAYIPIFKSIFGNLKPFFGVKWLRT